MANDTKIIENRSLDAKYTFQVGKFYEHNFKTMWARTYMVVDTTMNGRCILGEIVTPSEHRYFAFNMEAGAAQDWTEISEQQYLSLFTPKPKEIVLPTYGR